MLSKVRNAKGFTLIELMVVVAIIGIILAVAVPYYINYKRTACDTNAKSDVATLKGALENLATEMTEQGCRMVEGTNTRMMTPADITWSAGRMSSLVGYYGWGGTSQKCDVRIQYNNAGATPIFQGGAVLGRQPDGNTNRWIFRLQILGGQDLTPTKADPSTWNAYLASSFVNNTSMVGLDCAGLP